jgi:hypothetical protein
MSNVVFGEIDWNAGDVNEGSGDRKSDFMRLEPNSKNRVRVMGNPHQFYIHWVDTPEGKKRKVNSPVSEPGLVRRLEDAGFKRRPRWLVKVLDREDGQFKLLEIGSQIYNGIKNLYLDEDWGPVTQYDVTVDRGAPGQQPLYRVTPRPKSALESEFQAPFQEFNDRIDMTKLTQPADPAQVRETMGWSADADTPASPDGDFFNFTS